MTERIIDSRGRLRWHGRRVTLGPSSRREVWRAYYQCALTGKQTRADTTRRRFIFTYLSRGRVRLLVVPLMTRAEAQP